MTKPRSLAVIAGLVVVLAGCSAPAPTTSTDVAEVLATHKADWIEAATTSSDCAQAYVFNKSGAVDCYRLADSVDTTVALALTGLQGMGAPEGREGDFDALTATLEAVTRVPIRAVCGVDSTPNTNDVACTDIIVERTTVLGLLNRELVKWP